MRHNVVLKGNIESPTDEGRDYETNKDRQKENREVRHSDADQYSGGGADGAGRSELRGGV